MCIRRVRADKCGELLALDEAGEHEDGGGDKEEDEDVDEHDEVEEAGEGGEDGREV